MDLTKSDDNNLVSLPNEIIVIIISHLNIRDFQSILQTCKSIALFGSDELIWKMLATKHASDIFIYKPPQVDYKWLCLAKVSAYTFSRNSLAIYGNYKGDINDPKEDGIAISIRQKYVCSGLFKDGELNGYGICWIIDKNNPEGGNKYDGGWVDGKQSGYGKYYWNDGDYYEGEWLNGCRHGKGKYVWTTNATKYEGDFLSDDLHGKGKYTWKNGYYDGDWKMSKRHGYGEIQWANGNKYVGFFENHKKHGYGEYYWPDGANYKGYWKDDLRYGESAIIWKNGMVYVGNYENDLRNGSGQLFWPNGDRYKGKWVNGGRYGPGVFYSMDGSFEKQDWKEKERILYSTHIPPKSPK